MLEMHMRYNANIDNKTYELKTIFIKILKLKFHGILYHFKTQCIDDTYGSIE